jgi:hypothetical protein
VLGVLGVEAKKARGAGGLAPHMVHGDEEGKNMRPRRAWALAIAAHVKYGDEVDPSHGFHPLFQWDP